MRTRTLASECRYCLMPWKAGGKFHAPTCPIVTGRMEEWTRKKRATSKKERLAKEKAFAGGLDPNTDPYTGLPVGVSPPPPEEP